MLNLIRNKSARLRNKITLFFETKQKVFFNKKTPCSESYSYKILDPYSIFGEHSGFENFYLIGENWQRQDKRPIALLFQFNDWKLGFTSDYLPEYRTAFVPKRLGRFKLLLTLVKVKEKPKVFIIWGYKEGYLNQWIARLFDIRIIRMEDGFIRSSALGSSHATPYSLILDKTGLYYNYYKPSDLENILNTYDFKSDTKLIARAEESIKTIIDLKISKYNPPVVNANGLNKTIKTLQRIAVIGQVDSDASIRYGNPDRWNMEDLIRLAKYENPEATVFYRPHPEIYKGYQKSKFKKKRIKSLVTIVSPEEPLIDFLETIDHVYTITSLTGLEALIRGIKVTCVGAPFYSGWGLTDDRVKIDRRTAKLTLNELFAGAYLLYPRYLANFNDSFIGLSAACFRINADRDISLYKSCSVIANSNSTDKASDILSIAYSAYWPQIFFSSKTTLHTKKLSQILTAINFSKVFGFKDYFHQTIVVFSICGALSDNTARNIFITNIRMYLDHSVLNDLLIHLLNIYPGEYITENISWLLSENEEHSAAINIVQEKALALRKSLLEEMEDLSQSSEKKITTSNQLLELTYEECFLWKNILDTHMASRNIDEAIKIIKPLLLSNYIPDALIKNAITIAELKFDYNSTIRLSRFFQGFQLLEKDKSAVEYEVRASKFFNQDKTEYLTLLSKAQTIRPDLIALTQFTVGLFPELYNERNIHQLLEGMLALDKEISHSKARAYLQIEKSKCAVNTVRHIIESGDSSDKTRVLYAQALSFNGEISEAISVMAAARKVKLTTSNLRESLRLCVLTSNYDFSLQLLDLSEKYRINLGDMHKRKAYFGNRMIKKALETFTEINLTKTVATYYKEKYYRFSVELRLHESVFVLAIFGPGDEIRFASIYGLIRNILPTKHISVSCSPRLLDLFSRSFSQLEFVPVARPRYSEKINLENYSRVPGSDVLGVIDNNAVDAINKSDKILFVTDLLHRCLPDYDAFPGVPYLKADSNKTQHYKKRLPKNCKLVGLSWRSSLTTHSRSEHYLTIEELEPLFSIPGVTFINLQYDECDAELAWVQERYPNKIINFEEIDQYNDFDSVAALMMCTDLIISPATTVVELAGALGCRTWLFSNSSELNWRKIDKRGTDVWHNNTTIVEGDILGDKAKLVIALHKRLTDYLNQEVAVA